MMTENIDGPCAHTAGWLVSCVLHGSFVLAAALFVQQVQLAPQPIPFKWNVEMVTQELLATAPAPLPQLVSAPPSQARSTPVAVPTQLQPTPMVQEPAKLKTVQPQTPRATVPPAPTAPLQAVEPVIQEQPPIRPVMPSPPPMQMDSTPPIPQMEQTAQADSTPIIPETPTSTTAPTTPTITSEQAPPAADLPLTSPQPAQIASIAAPTSHVQAKRDYGWLSETILRRVEELKHYPAEARLDHAEGKVVLKAVIREDGTVDDVEVFQSSGFRSLDHAAVELMKQATPFHLPHPLGKSKVTVKIPMSYRLDR